MSREWLLQMIPFDPSKAVPGTILRGINPSTLFAGHEPLERSRIDRQHRLIVTGQTRWDMIEVNTKGVILSGNHGARAAAEANVAIDVLVVDFPQPSCGPILNVSTIP
jgi:hypothetical protein